ncbi:protein FAM135A [Trichonephila clavata]|uniref:Protein FAM135A n=1 Tax=Trichonephila clavata TaxID=2740835 RepID=A0A8X6HPV7_TRICU|nr:protein FAM135A [Trichonephila clavata]
MWKRHSHAFESMPGLTSGYVLPPSPPSIIMQVLWLNCESDSNVSLTDVNFLVEESTDDNVEGSRRTSQGSLGQKHRSPDISATPTSPSAYSWCPESISTSSLKSSGSTSKKVSLKDKIFHNFKGDVENEYEEYVAPSGAFSRFGQSSNTVVLLGVKKLDSCHSVACGIAKSSRIPFALEKGIRHSQSTLSVMSTIYTEGSSTITNSESMPDLTSGYVPPTPPPLVMPKAQVLNRNLENKSLSSELSREHLSYLVPERICSKSSSPSHFIKTNNTELANKYAVMKKINEKIVENGVNASNSLKVPSRR